MEGEIDDVVMPNMTWVVPYMKSEYSVIHHSECGRKIIESTQNILISTILHIQTILISNWTSVVLNECFTHIQQLILHIQYNRSAAYNSRSLICQRFNALHPESPLLSVVQYSAMVCYCLMFKRWIYQINILSIFKTRWNLLQHNANSMKRWHGKANMIIGQE